MDMEWGKVILELDEYIATCESRVKDILSVLEWNEEATLQETSSSSSTHRRSSNDSEQKRADDEPLLPESLDYKHSIVIDESKMKEILKTNNVRIPEKFSDIQVNFTREQYRELYDYVIFNTGQLSEPELKVMVSNVNHSDKSDNMTFAEIVASAKRRDKRMLTRKYRTSKLTYTEEVRNLVRLQMEALQKYFNPVKRERRSRSCEIIETYGHKQTREDYCRRSSSPSRHRRRKYSQSRSKSRSPHKRRKEKHRHKKSKKYKKDKKKSHSPHSKHSHRRKETIQFKRDEICR